MGKTLSNCVSRFLSRIKDKWRTRRSEEIASSNNKKVSWVWNGYEAPAIARSHFIELTDKEFTNNSVINRIADMKSKDYIQWRYIFAQQIVLFMLAAAMGTNFQANGPFGLEWLIWNRARDLTAKQKQSSEIKNHVPLYKTFFYRWVFGLVCLWVFFWRHVSFIRSKPTGTSINKNYWNVWSYSVQLNFFF